MLVFAILVLVSVLHYRRAVRNVTFTEIEENAFENDRNPNDLGTRDNFYEFMYKDQYSPSNIFDNSKSFYVDERSYYFSILGRYGKVVYSKTGLDIEDLYVKIDEKHKNLLTDAYLDQPSSPRGTEVPKNIDNIFMHRLSYKPQPSQNVLEV